MTHRWRRHRKIEKTRKSKILLVAFIWVVVVHADRHRMRVAADLCFQLIGGTAWAFSDESAVGKLDYLFVDEAGQVSVANLVGMAPSTKNIVVMGDQMQLSQPLKGAHPGDSGQSILNYLLQDHQTIPSDFGIFLGTTYRMHPDVCQFISSAVYEDRLKPAAVTNQRQILLPPSPKYLSQSAGILFVPVEHEGNLQASDEEAEVISSILKELMNSKFVENAVTRAMNASDVLIVAPYNMQVRSLKARHSKEHVGTVDKFQGKESPVVIVSMCASDGNDSPRGLEFLLSKNRLNVAISRAQCLAIVVGQPRLAYGRCSRLEQMQLVNLFCKIAEHTHRSE